MKQLYLSLFYKLKAIAKFLCHENSYENIKEILNIDGLEVFDKIAFALRFIDDEVLSRYFSNLIN